MNILFILIPISLLLSGAAVWAFLWAVNNDQFEDLEGPAHSILFDDDEVRSRPTTSKNETSESESP
jgi:cbb3-type cytochrome oxidase maturation protein